MWRTRKIALVIPAWDASETLPAVLARVPEWVDLVLVVDDGSARPLPVPDDPRVRVLRHPRNLGVGAAIRTGYFAAREAGMEVAVTWGADGQMDPADLPTLLQALEEGASDYAKGDRFSHPDCLREMPRVRRYGGYALTFLTRCVTGLWDLRDSQCGYTALRLEVLDRLPMERVYPRYGYPNDLLAMLVRAGCRVSQVTVRPVYRGTRSGLRPALALVVYPWLLIRAAMHRVLGRPRKGPPPRGLSLSPVRSVR